MVRLKKRCSRMTLSFFLNFFYKDQQISDAYSICNEVVMYSNRVVILAALQKRILKEFHVSHPRMSEIKSLMRSYVYWTNMDRDIKNIVKAYKGCALVAKAPSIKLSPWPKTNLPWSRIHINFARWFLLPNCSRQLFKMTGNF